MQISGEVLKIKFFYTLKIPGMPETLSRAIYLYRVHSVIRAQAHQAQRHQEDQTSKNPFPTIC
jgi:hypothetical protein